MESFYREQNRSSSCDGDQRSSRRPHVPDPMYILKRSQVPKEEKDIGGSVLDFSKQQIAHGGLPIRFSPNRIS
jgi:hypothetical protein